MNQSSHETLEHLRAVAFTCLIQLIEQFANGTCLTAEIQQARDALEALPLTTAEIATARNRLESACRYHKAGEHGAADYELWLLARSLTSN